MNNTWLYMILAALAGVCIALQASANGTFRRNLDNEYYAAFFSICGTFLTAIIFLAIYRPDSPSMAHLHKTQWWNWIGGPLGALIVLSGASLTRHLGAANFIALVVGGQLLCSVFLDHFALMGLPYQPISWGRIIGVILVIVGVICIKYL